MKHRTHAVVTVCTFALASLASGAKSEIWDKELTKADFVAFDQKCSQDEDAIRDLILQSDDIKDFKVGEIAVVGRIETVFFNGDCYECRGTCLFDLPSGQTVMPTFFFDERKVPLWYCIVPLAGESNWKVRKSAESDYNSLGSSFKCTTRSPLGIGCCDGQTKQAPQQRGTWRDFRRASTGQ